MDEAATFTVFYCYNCNKIDFGFSNIQKCLVCEGEIKHIRTFNSEKEAEIYCRSIKKAYGDVYSGIKS